jgi:hypothetical protein
VNAGDFLRREPLDAAVELLREAAWLHGLLEPAHPDFTTEEHEKAEERWLLDRVWPWLIVNGHHKRPYVPASLAADTTGGGDA